MTLHKLNQEDLEEFQEKLKFTHPNGNLEDNVINFFDKIYDYKTTLLDNFSYCDFTTEFWINDSIYSIYCNGTAFWCGYLESKDGGSLVILSALNIEADKKAITLFHAKSDRYIKYKKEIVYQHLRILKPFEYRGIAPAFHNFNYR